MTPSAVFTGGVLARAQVIFDDSHRRRWSSVAAGPENYEITLSRTAADRSIESSEELVIPTTAELV